MTKNPIVPAALAALSLLAGCAQTPSASDAATVADASGDDAALDASATDASMPADAGPGWQSLCDELATVLDRRATECGCSVTHVGCFGNRDIDATVEAGIAAGSIVYDEAALRDVVTAADAATGCGHLYELLGWTYLDYTTFGGAFTGTLAPLAACDSSAFAIFPSPCAMGYCAANPGGLRPYVCQPLVDVGSTCELLRLCVDFDTPAHPQTVGLVASGCGVGGPCVAPTRVGPGADGTACTTGSECASGACVGGRTGAVCGPPSADGTACNDPYDCQSETCVVSGTAGACGPGICML